MAVTILTRACPCGVVGLTPDTLILTLLAQLLGYTESIRGARRQGPAESREEMRLLVQKVLLIEDDKRIHKTLKLLFESEGYSLDVALDGRPGSRLSTAQGPLL